MYLLPLSCSLSQIVTLKIPTASFDRRSQLPYRLSHYIYKHEVMELRYQAICAARSKSHCRAYHPCACHYDRYGMWAGGY